jgi:hypothetical protein
VKGRTQAQRILGVDPGMVRTGVAMLQCRRGQSPRLLGKRTLGGAEGTSKDFQLALRTARMLAYGVSAIVRAEVPDVVAVETFTEQGPVRRGYTNRHLVPMCCQAIYEAAHHDGWARLLVWQDASTVLDSRQQTVLVANLLLSGTKHDEHQLSAVAHALYAAGPQAKAA